MGGGQRPVQQHRLVCEWLRPVQKAHWMRGPSGVATTCPQCDPLRMSRRLCWRFSPFQGYCRQQRSQGRLHLEQLSMARTHTVSTMSITPAALSLVWKTSSSSRICTPQAAQLVQQPCQLCCTARLCTSKSFTKPMARLSSQGRATMSQASCMESERCLSFLDGEQVAVLSLATLNGSTESAGSPPAAAEGLLGGLLRAAHVKGS